MKNYLLIAILIFAFFGCEPEVEDKIDLGPSPVASFEIENGSTPNLFILKNTTEGAFITQWNVEGIGTANGERVEFEIPFKGDYNVTMTTFNNGGSSSASKMITVTEDDPNSCFGNMQLLTNCDEKVWKLALEPGALNVGASLTETWWANSDADLSERDCLFNDEYIFRSNGEFVFDNKGDFWADTDGNGDVWPSDLGLNPGCQSTTDWPSQYAPWGSGSHSFSINNNTLTVVGEGAHLGLYKVGTSAEVASPQSSVALSISEMSENRMVLFADYSGVVWRLTFESE